jgi:DNA-binding transcriptional ArsR family regulator
LLAAMPAPNRSETNDLLTALRHPLRRQILRLMAGREASSPTELAASLSQPLSNVSYHVRVLANCGALELVRTTQVRGSMKHFYRSSMEPDWARFILATDEQQASNNNALGE